MIRSLLVLLTTLLLSFGAAQSVDFGYVEWPGVTVKTQVAANILDALGYDTSTESLSVPIILQGVSEGDLDVFLGVWRPSMNAMIESYTADSGDGSITLAAQNLAPTVYRPAVPTYVAEQGITSLADVAENPEMFDSELYGIEPGNDGNTIILDMIENDTYGFGDFDIVESSTEGMLSAVGRAIEREEPIAFLAWSPHWMNNVYDITYLDDPENVWGEDGFVATALNSGFAEENANLATFFSQFKVDPETQNTWIDRYSRQEMDPETVANEWIAANMDTVMAWVEGVTTADGEPAGAALESAFGSN